MPASFYTRLVTLRNEVLEARHAMPLRILNGQLGLLFLLIVVGSLFPENAIAASCTSQANMTAVQRDALSNVARTMVGEVRDGNIQALRANTVQEVAANFSGIAASVNNLKPLVQNATITVDSLYLLDSSGQSTADPRTFFYCGNPIVVLNFTNLPPGKYALAILHATGVEHPQQIALVLSAKAENQWMLGGFFSSPMTEAGHTGLWYWERAREYAEKKMNWNAWLYYQTAAPLLVPVQFLASPNVQKLQQEAEQVRPHDIPGANPLQLNAQGSTFEVTSIATTGALGGLDIVVHYIPNAAQLTQLRDPVAARKQVIDVMMALLTLRPELRQAFHGIWARADHGAISVYALDLPMKEIPSGTQPVAASVGAAVH